MGIRTNLKFTQNVLYAVLVYNFAILAGASYLCAEYNWSLWTLFWAILLMLDIKENTESTTN
jgi:hypothetical protein